MIHLKPKACDGPFLTLFQRDLLFAYREIDWQMWFRIAMVVSIALSLIVHHYPSMTFSSLPADVDTRAQCNSSNVQSQRAPCVMHSSIPAMFWKIIKQQSVRIGKLKNIIQDRVCDDKRNRRIERLLPYSM